MPRAWTPYLDEEDPPAYINGFFYGSCLAPSFFGDSDFLIQVGYQYGGIGSIYSIGSFYYPNSWDLTFFTSNAHDSLATLCLQISCSRQFQFNEHVAIIADDINFGITYKNQHKINFGKKINAGFSSQNAFSTYFDIFLPEIAGTAGTTILYVGTKGETYRDSGFATLACGYIGKRTISDSVVVSESKSRKGQIPFSDDVNIFETVRFSPRRYKETIQVSDYIDTRSIKVQTATSWLFRPDYRILIDMDDSGQFATTSWHERVQSFGNIDKAQKHWSGEYRVSEWNPVFADPYHELYGSFYGGTRDIRDRKIAVRAMVRSKPLVWTTQFVGRVKDTTWKDGRVTISTQDELRGLPDAEFVYDYQNIGTVIKGKSYGVVKAVVGTEVMFDDMGETRTIIRKKKSSQNFFNIAWNAVLGVYSAITANFAGVAFSAANIGFGLSGGGERVTNSYLEIEDDNLIPEDSVLGATLKFFPGSFSGTADNRNSPLFPRKEYTPSGGTFAYGLYATLYFEDTSGINVGDFIYSKKPLFFAGNPREVIQAILCGSSITNKYSYPGTYDERSWFGRASRETARNDFDSNWESEFSPLEQMHVQRVVDSSPFEEIKKLTESCQFYFYVNQDNKFAVSVINGKDVIRTATNISTYSQSYGNILDGFEFSRGIDSAYGGIVYRYAYDHKKNDFSRKIELYNKYSRFISKPKEIEAHWIFDDDDAYTMAHRALMRFGTGVDTVKIPTSLAGVVNNLGELIRVQHRFGSLDYKTFEIVGQAKNLDSGVDFDAESVEYANAQGIAEWGSGFGTYSSISRNSYSCLGRTTDAVATVGSVLTSYSPFATTIVVGGSKRQYEGRYVCFGSNAYGGVEICAVSSVTYLGALSSLTVTRSLFNTISRPIVANDTLYDLGPVSQKPNYTGFSKDALQPNTISGIRFATTQGINTAVGTSFRFF